MSSLFLLAVTGAAVLWDIRTGKVPNFLIAAGLGTASWFRLTELGIFGFWRFLGGSALPLLLLAVLFYFRMLGAGDIKLFLCNRRFSWHRAGIHLYGIIISDGSSYLPRVTNQTAHF